MFKMILPAVVAAAFTSQAFAEDEASNLTVIDGEDVTITEHHTKDELRERVEVDPDRGRPYVLIDSDGNGELDSSSGDPRNNDGLMMWSVRTW